MLALGYLSDFLANPITAHLTSHTDCFSAAVRFDVTHTDCFSADVKFNVTHTDCSKVCDLKFETPL